MTAPSVFDYPYDFTQQPGASATNVQSGAVQLFYTVNFMHDFFYDAGYDEIPIDNEIVFQTRLTVMMVGLVGAFSVMALVPRRNLGWFTTAGTATMVVYLFHSFVIKTVKAFGWPDFTAAHQVLGLVLTIVVAIVVALVLSRVSQRPGWRLPSARPRLNRFGCRVACDMAGLSVLR